ncbi:MAG: aminopeptidase P family protein [Pseudomonadota bacterium]
MPPIDTRIETIRQRLSANHLDALLVLVAENRYYLSGYTAEDSQFDETAGALIITADALMLATDSRFDVQAAAEAPLYEVVCYKRGLAEELPPLLKRLGVRRMGFESVRMTVFQHNKIKEALETVGPPISLVPVTDWVETQRAVKSEDEIEATRQALAIAEDAFEAALENITPGMTEKAAAWTLEKTMREAGADALSFPIICAVGPNSALPHAIPGGQVITAGAPLLFDWGARYGHYCSDISRTIVIGSPDDMFRKVYRAVREAQLRAIDAIRTGVSSKAVDTIARETIAAAGFAGKFGHGLGHGTGIAVHEAPRLSPLKDTALEAGMIVTVEPGIYLPEWGGVRLENQVVVRDEGAEVLNRLGFIDNI